MRIRARRLRIIQRIGLLIAGAFLLGLLASWIIAGALVAPVHREATATPAELNVELITLQSKSGATIAGWHCRAEPARGVVVLLHGIRSSRSAMLPRARMLRELGYSSVLIDLQGHGESTGERITLGYLERHDVEAAVQYSRQCHPGESVAVLGVSLGGAAATLASPLGIDALILESVYPNIDDAIRNRVEARLGRMAAIPTALLRIQIKMRLGIAPSQLRPIDKIASVGCPVFIISGVSDVHTPESETREIFERANAPKDLWLVEKAAHVDLMQHAPEAYRERVSEFLRLHLRDD